MNVPDSTPPYRPDSTADDGGSARWMSFAELADARGISKASAIKLIRRHRWRRQRDNQGHVLALVPLPWTVGEGDEEPDRGADDPGDSTPDSTPDISNKNSIFEVALSALREAKDGEIATLRAACDQALAQAADAQVRADVADADRRIERERAERAVQALTDANTRADRAEQALAGERQRADSLRDRLDIAERTQREAEATAEELRQGDIARQARGLLARLRDAWRGG